MNEVAKPECRRFQFGLRRLLLWTAVVALGLGILSYAEPPLVGWIVVPGWFATVLILRWGVGSQWAATASVTIGMLFYAWDGYKNSPQCFVEAAVYGGLLGGVLGCVYYGLMAMIVQIINWLDRIGQPHG